MREVHHDNQSSAKYYFQRAAAIRCQAALEFLRSHRSDTLPSDAKKGFSTRQRKLRDVDFIDLGIDKI